MVNWLHLYSTFLVCWPLKAFYTKCHIHTHLHMLMAQCSGSVSCPSTLWQADWGSRELKCRSSEPQLPINTVFHLFITKSICMSLMYSILITSALNSTNLRGVSRELALFKDKPSVCVHTQYTVSIAMFNAVPLYSSTLSFINRQKQEKCIYSSQI